jgi:hypothetical protein
MPAKKVLHKIHSVVTFGHSSVNAVLFAADRIPWLQDDIQSTS